MNLKNNIQEIIINPGVEPHLLFNDPMQMHKILNDKIKVPYLSGKMLPTFLDLQVIINSNIYSNKLNIPMLFLISMKDSLCQPNFVMNIYSKLKNPQKEIVFFEKAKHEVLQEAEYSEALEKILDWTESVRANAIGFKAPRYIKFNYSIVDWRKVSKKVVLLLFVLYLVFKRKRILRIFQMIFTSKFSKMN